ncbi:MAG TPA: M48 family metalloprotease [Nevskiaceae bacterium]|nr:M48 family metalloprotease [Nevskiaceae bacterium]
MFLRVSPPGHSQTSETGLIDRLLHAALVALLALLMFVGAQSSAFAQTTVDQTLPDLGEPANVALSPAHAAAIARQIVGEMYQANYIVTDPELTSYINSIGWKLAYHGSAEPPAFHFYPIADNGINAFALPGATIGVNVGTLVAAQDESELAAVMAHEEAHVTQNHIARQANQSPIASIATWAAIIAAMIASSGNPNVVMGGLMAGQSINAQRDINYTRGHEMEADRVGIRTLAAAGYDPMAMADFFGRLQQQTRLYGSVPQLLLDHPVNTTRIAEATERAQQYPKITPAYSIRFHLLRARGRVLETDLPTDALKYFSDELASGHATPGTHYGYAMSLHRLGKDAEAWTALRPLLKGWPNQPNVLLLESRILAGQGKLDEALEIDREMLTSQPSYAPAILRYATDLIAHDQPELARAVLLDHHPAYAIDPHSYELLAKAASESGNTGEAAFQMASYFEARADPFGALDQLNAGLRLKKLSPNNRARLRARREQLVARLPANLVRQHERRTGGPG